VVVRRANSEHGENGERHKGLDWSRPPESKTLHPVCGGIMRESGQVPSNGALGHHIWSTG
jgi:hypothetical protein